MTKIKVKTARSLLQLLWPKFVKVDSVFFFAQSAPSADSLERLLAQFDGDRTALESMSSHTHISDVFGQEFELDEPIVDVSGTAAARVLGETYWDDHHPDFAIACDVGRKIAEMWFCKLRLQFPNTRFRVYYTERDNPVVRFHAVRDAEPFWLGDDADRAEIGDFLIYDTDA